MGSIGIPSHKGIKSSSVVKRKFARGLLGLILYLTFTGLIGKLKLNVNAL
jgi:hypothetical protein